MKTYTVYFSEPVTIKYKGDRFNKELKSGNTMWTAKRQALCSPSIPWHLQRSLSRRIWTST